MAVIRPTLPSWINSSFDSFEEGCCSTMETTRERFASTKVLAATSDWSSRTRTCPSNLVSSSLVSGAMVRTSRKYISRGSSLLNSGAFTKSVYNARATEYQETPGERHFENSYFLPARLFRWATSRTVSKRNSPGATSRVSGPNCVRLIFSTRWPTDWNMRRI